jgi:hypothetical protein
LEQEVEEDKTKFFDALKGLEVTREHTCHFDTKDNITVMCNKAQNKLNRLRTQEKKETNDLLTCSRNK